MKPTLASTPKALKRTPTLHGVAPCAQAPQVVARSGRYATGYYTSRSSARTREAVRIDIVRRVGKP